MNRCMCLKSQNMKFGSGIALVMVRHHDGGF